MNNSVNVQNANNSELKKAILVGVIISVVGSIVVIFILKFFVFGVHKNTTGLSDYRAASVNLNCTYNHSEGDTDISMYSDFIYNYQKKYKLAVYNRMVIKYQNSLTDDKVTEMINRLNSLDCTMDSNKDFCVSSRLNFAPSKSGWSYTTDKASNTLTVIFYNYYGSGKRITATDKEQIKTHYQNEGYVCE